MTTVRAFYAPEFLQYDGTNGTAVADAILALLSGYVFQGGSATVSESSGVLTLTGAYAYPQEPTNFVFSLDVTVNETDWVNTDNNGASIVTDADMQAKYIVKS